MAPAPVKAPRYTYERLRQIAASFHAKFHPTLTLPVPIEKIVEYDLQMDIVPMHGLCNMVKDGWISRDLSTIYVDDYFYKKRETRYLFTLAHEVSHKILHAEIIQSFDFETIDEWKTSEGRIPADQLHWIEWQANSLGGLILVPEGRLETCFTQKVNEAFDAGVDVHAMSTEVRKRAFDPVIAKEFGVSTKVVTIRLECDQHVPKQAAVKQ